MVEARRVLRASREHVFAFVAHPEHLPRYGAPLWLAADPEDRRGGEPLITLRGYFAGLPVEAVIRSASRAPQSLDLTQVRGTLRGFSQRFRIESDDEGTVLTCRVEADPGIPMLSDEAAKHFLIQYVERMLDRVRLAAERRAPSRRPRPAVKAGADADADAEAGDTPGGETIAAAEAAEPDREPETTVGGTISEPAGSPDPAGPPPRRPRRPFLSRRFRPQRAAGPQHAGASPRAPEPAAPAPADHAGGSDAAAAGQGRRRRRRRRRRGRGPSGAGPGGGAPSAGPSGNP